MPAPQSEYAVTRSMLIVLFAGTLLSSVLFGLLLRYERQEAAYDFQHHSASLLESMQRQMDLAGELVDSVGSLYDASERVGRDEFRRFATAQLDRHGEIQALAWLPRVGAGTLAEYESAVRGQGLTDYAVTEVGPDGSVQPLKPRAEYFPVHFVEPLAGNRPVLGIDLAANPVRREAMERARDSGGMIASGAVTLLQPQGGRLGFLIFRPVYQRMEIPPEATARREQLRGYAAGVFRIAELVASTQRLAGTEFITFELFDTGDGKPLFRSLQHALADPDLSWEGEVFLPGRTWRVVFTPTAMFLADHRRGTSWLALMLGLLVTLLVSYHLHSTTRRARHLEEANRALAASRELIEHAHREWMDAFDTVSDPIFLHDAEGRVMRANRAYARCAAVDYAEIIGRPYWEVFPPGSGPSAACVLTQKGQDVEEEDEVNSADGHVYASRTFAIRDDAGSYRYSIHILRDVTLQRDAERNLQAAQLRAQRYLDIAAVVLLALDTEGRITLINRKGCETLGYSEEELLGQNWLERFIPQNGRHEAQKLFAAHIADQPVEYAENWIVRRSGERRLIAWHNTVLHDAAGKVTGTLSSGMDITERHRLEQALRESQLRLQSIFDAARDGILVADIASRKFMLANRAMAEMLQYSEAELYWLGVDDIHPQDQLDYVHDQFARQARGEFTLARDLPLQRRDGSVFYTDVNSVPVEMDGRPCILGIFHDTTARRAMEASLRSREEQLALAMQGSDDGLWDWDVASGRVYYSPRWKSLLGHGEDEVGDSLDEWKDRVHPDDLPGALAELETVMAGTDEQLQMEIRMRHKDGHWVWIQSRGHVVRDAAGKPERLVGTHEDVSVRREAEERAKNLAGQLQKRLQESRCLYRVAQLAEDKEASLPLLLQRVANFLPEGWQYPEVTTARIRYQGQTYVSPRFSEGGHALSALVQVDGAEMGSVEVFYTADRPSQDEGPFLREERTLIEAVADQLGQIIVLRLSQQTLARLNRVLRTLNLSNRALVYASSEAEFEQEICDVLVREAGYRAAWIGHRDEGGDLHTVAHCGINGGGVDDVSCRNDDTVSRIVCTALERCEMQRGTITESEVCPMCAGRQDAASVIALPLLENDAALGVLYVCASQAEPFAPAEVELLQELADDLAYGIRMRRTAGERDWAQAELSSLLIKTVSVIALTVEKRDPYTAGHMQRVAGLAVAIGRELGLPEGRLTGLQMGSLIHDIGKIYIPAEILNRPGRLSGVEFDLIKTHPQVGYDIVRGISFPWPVADMILQHHERLDGSGYPQGLHGDDICLEARILAVADVVEAMASHRPYRAALPLRLALNEIEQHQGDRYDPAVVEVCLRLFRERGFVLAEPSDA